MTFFEVYLLPEPVQTLLHSLTRQHDEGEGRQRIATTRQERGEPGA